MTSDTTTSTTSYLQAYVWIWLPNSEVPVVAGVLSRDGKQLVFNYGRSYLARADAIALYAPELSLQTGAIPLLQHSVRQHRRPCSKSCGVLGWPPSGIDTSLRYLPTVTRRPRGIAGHADFRR